MVIPDTCKKWIEMQRTRNIDFEQNIKHDFDLIKPYLPTNCYKIFDIGCGIGGIDVYLSRYYNFAPFIYLFDFLDKQYTDKIQYGYNETYKGYNSFEETRKFIKANGIKKYEYINAEFGIPKRLGEIDIIISLLSWGYHYPVETYLDEIIPLMSEDGILIMDVREDTDGIKKLRKYFRNIKILAKENKAVKIIAKEIKGW